MAGIIKVNQYQDFNGNTLFTSDGSGNLTTQKINYPAFEAYLSANQSVSDATITKGEFDTEVLDTDNCYDNTTNYRFTPNVAGKYFVTGHIQAAVASDNLYDGIGRIYKNGSSYRETRVNPQNGSPEREVTLHTTAIIDMNGTTDYVEYFGYIDVGGGSPQFSSDDKGSYFSAYRIGS